MKSGSWYHANICLEKWEKNNYNLSKIKLSSCTNSKEVYPKCKSDGLTLKKKRAQCGSHVQVYTTA